MPTEYIGEFPCIEKVGSADLPGAAPLAAQPQQQRTNQDAVSVLNQRCQQSYRPSVHQDFLPSYTVQDWGTCEFVAEVSVPRAGTYRGLACFSKAAAKQSAASLALESIDFAAVSFDSPVQVDTVSLLNQWAQKHLPGVTPKECFTWEVTPDDTLPGVFRTRLRIPKVDVDVIDSEDYYMEPQAGKAASKRRAANLALAQLGEISYPVQSGSHDGESQNGEPGDEVIEGGLEFGDGDLDLAGTGNHTDRALEGLRNFGHAWPDVAPISGDLVGLDNLQLPVLDGVSATEDQASAEYKREGPQVDVQQGDAGKRQVIDDDDIFSKSLISLTNAVGCLVQYVVMAFIQLVIRLVARTAPRLHPLGITAILVILTRVMIAIYPGVAWFLWLAFCFVVKDAAAMIKLLTRTVWELTGAEERRAGDSSFVSNITLPDIVISPNITVNVPSVEVGPAATSVYADVYVAVLPWAPWVIAVLSTIVLVYATFAVIRCYLAYRTPDSMVVTKFVQWGSRTNVQMNKTYMQAAREQERETGHGLTNPHQYCSFCDRAARITIHGHGQLGLFESLRRLVWRICARDSHVCPFYGEKYEFPLYYFTMLRYYNPTRLILHSYESVPSMEQQTIMSFVWPTLHGRALRTESGRFEDYIPEEDSHYEDEDENVDEETWFTIQTSSSAKRAGKQAGGWGNSFAPVGQSNAGPTFALPPNNIGTTRSKEDTRMIGIKQFVNKKMYDLYDDNYELGCEMELWAQNKGDNRGADASPLYIHRRAIAQSITHELEKALKQRRISKLEEREKQAVQAFVDKKIDDMETTILKDYGRLHSKVECVIYPAFYADAPEVEARKFRRRYRPEAKKPKITKTVRIAEAATILYGDDENLRVMDSKEASIAVAKDVAERKDATDKRRVAEMVAPVVEAASSSSKEVANNSQLEERLTRIENMLMALSNDPSKQSVPKQPASKAKAKAPPTPQYLPVSPNESGLPVESAVVGSKPAPLHQACLVLLRPQKPFLVRGAEVRVESNGLLVKGSSRVYYVMTCRHRSNATRSEPPLDATLSVGDGITIYPQYVVSPAPIEVVVEAVHAPSVDEVWYRFTLPDGRDDIEEAVGPVAVASPDELAAVKQGDPLVLVTCLRKRNKVVAEATPGVSVSSKNSRLSTYNISTTDGVCRSPVFLANGSLAYGHWCANSQHNGRGFPGGSWVTRPPVSVHEWGVTVPFTPDFYGIVGVQANPVDDPAATGTCVPLPCAAALPSIFDVSEWDLSGVGIKPVLSLWGGYTEKKKMYPLREDHTDGFHTTYYRMKPSTEMNIAEIQNYAVPPDRDGSDLDIELAQSVGSRFDLGTASPWVEPDLEDFVIATRLLGKFKKSAGYQRPNLHPDYILEKGGGDFEQGVNVLAREIYQFYVEMRDGIPLSETSAAIYEAGRYWTVIGKLDGYKLKKINIGRTIQCPIFELKVLYLAMFFDFERDWISNLAKGRAAWVYSGHDMDLPVSEKRKAVYAKACGSLSLDMTAWDRRMTADMVLGFFKHLHASRPGVPLVILSYLAHITIYTILVTSDGHMFQKSCGNPSGFMSTLHLNCVVMLHCWLAVLIKTDPHISRMGRNPALIYRYIRANYHIEICGDDSRLWAMTEEALDVLGVKDTERSPVLGTWNESLPWVVKVEGAAPFDMSKPFEERILDATPMVSRKLVVLPAAGGKYLFDPIYNVSRSVRGLLHTVKGEDMEHLVSAAVLNASLIYQVRRGNLRSASVEALSAWVEENDLATRSMNSRLARIWEQLINCAPC